MVTLQYYDELKEAVKVPSSITDFFASSVDDSNEEKLFYSVMLEVGLPVEKWLFYVITHEENAFKRFFDCEPNENDRRLCPKELFYCLRPLSDENRRFIFGKLSDISDGVINKLSKYVEEDNLVEFSNVINETNINTSSIASICMNVKALIDNYNAMEQLYLNVGQIIQIDDEAEMFRQMEKVFNVFLSNFESINGDEQATDQVVNYVNNLFEELSRNDNFSEVASDLTIKKHHYCLWLYHHIWPDDNQSKGFVTRVALDYLEELVFNPKYEKYWKGYEDDTCLGELDKEMKNWLGVAIEENQKEEVKDIPINGKIDFIEQERTKEEEHLYPDSKYEFVPENYFEPDCISRGHLEEHYELVERVKKHGLQAFVDFINYIASEGFIENNDENKALFAYRLTGRMRPEKLDAIPWFKEKGEPKELYYIIKYFSPRTRKKFSKQMKDYFENEYFGVADYSRTAEDVSDDFKKKLEDFFPGLTNTRKG